MMPYYTYSWNWYVFLSWVAVHSPLEGVSEEIYVWRLFGRHIQPGGESDRPPHEHRDGALKWLVENGIT